MLMERIVLFASENEHKIFLSIISFLVGISVGLGSIVFEVNVDASDYIALSAALVAVAALCWQVRESNKQSKMQTFLTYTQRYQDVLVNLPIEIENSTFKPSEDEKEKEITLRWLRAYFDLCSEQYYLSRRKLIDLVVWHRWQGGMRDYLKKPAFLWAWEEIQSNGYYHGEFASFIEGLIEIKA